ncbi:MAG TPA: methylmalonyl Co-A mutase-associated GTPase MeaB [Gemmatimonadaceae bacterium]|nr:methylmalonyl Co-A mutase-associated GTPase MeaB [Gemmatimonadaceae bacterium]
MTTAPPALADRSSLLAAFDAGKTAALARAVSMVENQRDGFEQLLSALHSRVGRARRIGVTGPPGAGKSTLTTQLISTYRAAGLKVGVIAVDPTSPFTGGALLGDRVRMESVALDPGVYIRSLATRGSLGGISSATRSVADVLDAFGFDRILMETVGVGQSELEIARAADTTVVVLVPESGDSIQALKAGLMEIADIFVVNKADRPGAERVRNDIELMLGMRHGHAMDAAGHHGVDLKAVANPGKAARQAAREEQSERWTPPVVLTTAHKGEGIADLAGFLDRHHHYLEDGGELRERRRRRLREQVMDVADYRLRRRLWSDEQVKAFVDSVIPRIERGEVSPYGIADELLIKGAPAIARTSS